MSSAVYSIVGFGQTAAASAVPRAASRRALKLRALSELVVAILTHSSTESGPEKSSAETTGAASDPSPREAGGGWEGGSEEQPSTRTSTRTRTRGFMLREP